MACCSAWILERLWFSLNLGPAISSLLTKITPFQLPTLARRCFRPCRSESFGRRIHWFLGCWWNQQVAAIGWAQILGQSSVCSPCVLSRPSALMMIGVFPAKMHKASLDVLWYTLAISMFMSICTLMYLRLLNSLLSASLQPGAPYIKSGRIALCKLFLTLRD